MVSRPPTRRPFVAGTTSSTSAAALMKRRPATCYSLSGGSSTPPTAGHDGIQLAIGQIFQRGKDHLFLYYRDLLAALSAGMTVEEMILNGISKATDPTSGGRHMSDHYAKVEWGIHNISSCVAAHDSQAVGLARALDYYGVDGVAIASHGESSASEATSSKLSTVQHVSASQSSSSSRAMAMGSPCLHTSRRLTHASGRTTLVSAISRSSSVMVRTSSTL